jgi:hypothetical protein
VGEWAKAWRAANFEPLYNLSAPVLSRAVGPQLSELRQTRTPIWTHCVGKNIRAPRLITGAI